MVNVYLQNSLFDVHVKKDKEIENCTTNRFLPNSVAMIYIPFLTRLPQATKNVVQQNVEGPMKAMADIRLRLEHGASVNEVNAAYEAHEFPELEKVDSQMAMIKAVERVGQSASVHEVLLQECIGKKEVDLQNVGFKALISTLSKESFKVDEVITQFQPEDFREEVVQERLAQLVTEAQDLDLAETTTTKSQIDLAEGSQQSVSQVTKAPQWS